MSLGNGCQWNVHNRVRRRSLIFEAVTALSPRRRKDGKRRDRQAPEARGHARATDQDEVRFEFRPAPWLLASLALLKYWFVRPRLGKRALVGLAWRFLPRRFKLIAGGAATLALVLLIGAVGVFVVVVQQLA